MDGAVSTTGEVDLQNMYQEVERLCLDGCWFGDFCNWYHEVNMTVNGPSPLDATNFDGISTYTVFQHQVRLLLLLGGAGDFLCWFNNFGTELIYS